MVASLHSVRMDVNLGFSQSMFPFLFSHVSHLFIIFKISVIDTLNVCKVKGWTGDFHIHDLVLMAYHTCKLYNNATVTHLLKCTYWLPRFWSSDVSRYNVLILDLSFSGSAAISMFHNPRSPINPAFTLKCKTLLGLFIFWNLANYLLETGGMDEYSILHFAMDW